MTGATVTLEIRDQAVVAALDKLAQADLEPLLEVLREHLLVIHDDHWTEQQAPDGTPWAPLSPKYAARKAKARPGRGILIYDELLRLLASSIEGDTVVIGTNRVYGATQQFGDPYRNIPARPFLGVSDQDEADLLGIIQDYVAGLAG